MSDPRSFMKEASRTPQHRVGKPAKAAEGPEQLALAQVERADVCTDGYGCGHPPSPRLGSFAVAWSQPSLLTRKRRYE